MSSSRFLQEKLITGDMTLKILHPEVSAADRHGCLRDKNIVVRTVSGEFAACNI